MNRLIILRHGETDWNRKERFRGLEDLSLNERGFQQVMAAARRIALLKPNFIYSSPLKRARQTAETIGNFLNLPVNIEKNLKDVDYGLWQGLTPGEAYSRFRKSYLDWLHRPEMVHFPGGESLSLVQERVKNAFKDMEEKHKEGAVLVVTHKVPCKVFLLFLLGLDLSHFWQIHQDVAALNVYEKLGAFLMARSLNDTCYLKSPQ